MKKTIYLAPLFFTSFFANAGLVNTDYNATLTKGAFYCNSIGDLYKLTDATVDQDDRAVNRIFSNGNCTMVERSIRVGVIQEDRSAGFAAIIFPSGKKTGITPLKALKK